jgi:hypothetical protein
LVPSLLAETGEQEQATAAMAGYALRVAEQAAAGLQTGTAEIAAALRLDAEDVTMSQFLAWAMHRASKKPRQPDGLRTEALADPVGARRGGVSLVEQQIQDGENPAEALRQEVRGRHAVGDPGIADLALGADQALGHGGLRDQAGAGDLGGGQAGERAQRQGDPGFELPRRVTAGEDQAQLVVPDAALVAARSGSPPRAGTAVSWSLAASVVRRRSRSMARFAMSS